jgi:hypothetical protein
MKIRVVVELDGLRAEETVKSTGDVWCVMREAADVARDLMGKLWRRRECLEGVLVNGGPLKKKGLVRFVRGVNACIMRKIGKRR